MSYRNIRDDDGTPAEITQTYALDGTSNTITLYEEVSRQTGYDTVTVTGLEGSYTVLDSGMPTASMYCVVDGDKIIHYADDVDATVSITYYGEGSIFRTEDVLSVRTQAMPSPVYAGAPGDTEDIMCLPLQLDNDSTLYTDHTFTGAFILANKPPTSDATFQIRNASGGSGDGFDVVVGSSTGYGITNDASLVVDLDSAVYIRSIAANDSAGVQAFLLSRDSSNCIPDWTPPAEYNGAYDNLDVTTSITLNGEEVTTNNTYCHSATSNPTATNDGVDTGEEGHEFLIGDLWVNTTTTTVFICLDNATEAAIWKKLYREGKEYYMFVQASAFLYKNTSTGVTGSYNIRIDSNGSQFFGCPIPYDIQDMTAYLTSFRVLYYVSAAGDYIDSIYIYGQDPASDAQNAYLSYTTDLDSTAYGLSAELCSSPVALNTSYPSAIVTTSVVGDTAVRIYGFLIGFKGGI